MDPSKIDMDLAQGGFDFFKSQLISSPLAMTTCHWRHSIDFRAGHRLSSLGLVLRGGYKSVITMVSNQYLDHEKMHSKKIGLTLDGKSISWVNWWEAPKSFWPIFRILSRGSNWSFWNSDKYFDNTTGSQISYKAFGCFHRKLKESGFTIVKEDKGSRYVIVPNLLLNTWFEIEAEKMAIREEKYTSDRKPAKIFFLAKTHKPLPLKGRMVQAFMGKKPKAPFGSELLKKWNFRILREAFSHLKARTFLTEMAAYPEGDSPNIEPRRIFSGDIESMFPNTDRVLLHEKLLEKLPLFTVKRIMGELKAYRLNFNGRTYQVMAGLPIGHPWSPLLAEFLVGELEENIGMCYRENNQDQAIFLRYMDDTLFSVPEKDKEWHKTRYQKAILPYKVEWEDKLEEDPRISFLDSSLSRISHPDMAQEKFMEFTMNKMMNPPEEKSFLDDLFTIERKDRTVYGKRQVVITEVSSKHVHRNFSFPMGFVPETVVISTFINKALRVISVMVSSSRFQWPVLYALLTKKLKLVAFDQLVDLMEKSGYKTLMGRVRKVVWRHISPGPSDDRKILTLEFSPKWTRALGKRELKEIQVKHRIRWNFDNAKRSVAILRH